MVRNDRHVGADAETHHTDAVVRDDRVLGFEKVETSPYIVNELSGIREQLLESYLGWVAATVRTKVDSKGGDTFTLEDRKELEVVIPVAAVLMQQEHPRTTSQSSHAVPSSSEIQPVRRSQGDLLDQSPRHRVIIVRGHCWCGVIVVVIASNGTTR